MCFRTLRNLIPIRIPYIGEASILQQKNMILTCHSGFRALGLVMSLLRMLFNGADQTGHRGAFWRPKLQHSKKEHSGSSTHSAPEILQSRSNHPDGRQLLQQRSTLTPLAPAIQTAVVVDWDHSK